MSTFPTAEPWSGGAVSGEKGRAEGGGCSRAPACPGAGGTGQKITAVTPPPSLMYMYLCAYLYTLYRYLYILLMY